MTLAGPGFRDFEDYQFLQSYDDFGDTHNLLDDHDVDYYLNSCLPMEAASNFGASIGFGDPFSGGTFNFDEYTPPFEMDTQDSGVEPMTFHRHEGFQSFNYANVQRDLYTPPPSSVASSDGGDVILNALLLADARKCDDCNYPFTDGNGPEVFGDCGHMVCKSCYVWGYDLSQGRCAQCYKGRDVKPKPRQEQSKAKPKKSKQNSEKNPSPAKRSRGNTGNVVHLSFPKPVQFIMDKEEPIAPGSPDKGMFRYSITADTLSVRLGSNASISTALDFLKDIHIEEAIPPTGSSSPDVEVPVRQPSPKLVQVLQPVRRKGKRYSKSEATGGNNFLTILIGTQGQIKRAVKRQAHMDINANQSNCTETSPSGYPQYGGGYIHNLQTLSQQTKRRVVLLPNFSKLNKLNIRPQQDSSNNS